jgi:beta-galactosidase
MKLRPVPSALLTFCLLLAGAPLPALLAAEGDYVWIEGEAAQTSFKPNIAGWGNKQFLSGEKWLHISVDADKVDEAVPAEGVLLKYPFEIETAADYEIWNRIGFEFARSLFAWRIDGDEWKAVSPDELTTDLMEIDFFCEVAWLKLGRRKLDAGTHSLEIKLPKQRDGQGKWERLLYAGDALCVHRQMFFPRGKLEPDESGKEAVDLEAEKQIFVLPAAETERSSVRLEGLWEICRDDEQMPGEVAAPMQGLPERPFWRGIPVPSDKNASRPDLIFAHRLWYRTRVRVPEGGAGKSFYLVFPQNNLNTTVYVNGVFCGFDKNPFARVQIDVSRAMKPGINEIRVGIRDAWYARTFNPKNPLALRKTFNLPKKFFNDGFQRLAYPVWAHPESGILVTPELVCAGTVYASDVFCKPSVRKQELALDVTIANGGEEPSSGEVLCEAVNAQGAVEKRFAAKAFELEGRGTKTLALSETWEKPNLWWPDEPTMYRLRTTVKTGGKVLDVSETPFGFREWAWDGRDFKLNGVVWHGWADTHTHASKEEWLDFYRRTNQRFMRFWGTSWMNLPPEAALDFFDRSGVVVRRSGMLDGEAIGYMAIEEDPDLKEAGTEVKMDLMRNWRDQVMAQVKGERNHPSVMIWSIENEWLYINCINLYGGLMDQFEALVTETSRAISAADPTRPNMTDGGGAGKAQTMPVHGDHYTTGSFPLYPGLAYDVNAKGGGRGRWEWDERRPRFIGEELYTGHDPAFAYFGGDEVFIGKQQARRAVGLADRMLTEGYRWSGCGAWHFWQTQDIAQGQYEANPPRAVFCREWDWTFGSSQPVRRTLGLFNDTRYDDPIRFTWTFNVDGKKVAGESRDYRVGPGTSEKFDLTLTMPSVEGRSEGELLLSLAVGNKEVFRDRKDVSVLKPTSGTSVPEKGLFVFDPQGTTTVFLKKAKLPFTAIGDLAELPEPGKVLIVGQDALDEKESASSRLAAYAAGGGRVVVLEQRHPLKYQGVPADIEADANEGRTAFAEDLGHPSLRHLAQKDFFTWGPDEIVYRNAYRKPSRGAKSLVQCHEKLENSALVEVPVADGLLLLCQLVVADKLGSNPVAQQLLLNLLDHAATYRLTFREVATCTEGAAPLAATLDAIGLKYTKAGRPLEAIKTPGATLAVIAATPGHLKELAANLGAVERFTKNGGWIVFHGLTPEGLADYNQIVGVEHLIRPFRRERVTLPVTKNRLMSGLTLNDVVMYSSEQIFPWAPGNYVASDIFNFVVDFDDVAPFCQFPDDFTMNMVNGMVSADAWKYIVNVPAPTDPPLDWLLKLPRQEELVEMEWIGNTFYYPVTRVELIADGKQKASFETLPNNEPQVFEIAPPLKGRQITLRLAAWDKLPGKGAVTGLDNIRLKAKRTTEFYERVRPMLNVGGLMEYPRGSGGIVLCNLLLQDAGKEQGPTNSAKKQTILTTILRNLQAPFSGGKTLIAGSSLNYAPLDISRHATQYRDEKGWFGDKRFTFKDMPTGVSKFAGVPYNVYEFPTSPVPTVLMLKGNGLPEKLPEAIQIDVNRKADAIFFLHAARLDARRNPQEVKEKKRYEMLRYVVHYEDGERAEVPIYAETDIDDYRQESPRTLPGAQIAWTRPYEGTGQTAVAYSKQWNNPRPDVTIKSIDMVYGSEPRGVPALIAVTTATAADKATGSAAND